MRYDNTTYWQEMHKAFPDSLKAVGISSLTEEYNALKYASESTTLMEIFNDIVLPSLVESDVRILDVGAGTGVWSEMMLNFFLAKGFRTNVTALDISPEALETIKKRNPSISVVEQDLKKVNPDLFRETHDIVLAVCCLHHIVDIQDYLHAAIFTARSVRKGGFLLIEDPILRKPYSRFYQTDFPTYEGHSFPRPAYILDDIMQKEGLTRVHVRNALSFFLGGNVESYSRTGYFVQHKLWNFFYYLGYRSHLFVRMFAPAIRQIDKFLKSTSFSNGISVVVYRKC